MSGIILMLAMVGVGQYPGWLPGYSRGSGYSYDVAYAYVADPFGGSVGWVYGYTWRRSWWDEPYSPSVYRPWVNAPGGIIDPGMRGHPPLVVGR